MDSPNMSVFKLICIVYVYMMLMAAANIANCESKKHGQCGDQWSQAFTVSGGALTTLWAYLTDNPLHTAKMNSEKDPMPGGRRSSPRTPTPGTTKKEPE